MLRTKEDAGQDPPSREEPIDGPFEYLLTSSGASIESFHLSRLNAVANLRKELHELFEEWVEAEVQARLAQWLLARKNSENLALEGPFTHPPHPRPPPPPLPGPPSPPPAPQLATPPRLIPLGGVASSA